MIWIDGFVPFLFGKSGSSFLVSCSLCRTEATLSVSAGPVCSRSSAEACAILHGLCWSRQHQQSAIFLFFFSYLTLTTLSSPPSFLLSQTLWQKLSFSSCTIRLQWVPGHSLFPGNDAADELTRWGALLVLSAISFSLFLLSLVSTLIFFWTGGS